MNERIIVCGSRDFSNKALCFESLERILKDCQNLEIVSGHAKGADMFGEEYAAIHSLKITVFKPDWKQYGRGAGPIRNREMLKYAMEGKPIVIAFWDGKSKGTKNMIDQAKKVNATVHVISY